MSEMVIRKEMMTDKKMSMADFLKKGMPSALCSGCWPEDELEAYLKKTKGKKVSDKSETSGNLRDR